MIIKVNFNCKTNGSGYWSRKPTTVIITELELKTYGELRVYFDPNTWNTEKWGMIFSDKQFIHDLKEQLANIGLSEKIKYTEMGVQGDEDYVSFDVEEEFIRVFEAKYSSTP